MNQEQETIRRILKNALDEDLGPGDVTTESILRVDQRITGKFITKEEGVVAGLDVLRELFAVIDAGVLFHPDVVEGEKVPDGTVLATATGPGRAVLSGERVALNILQRMSGIATVTRQYVDAVKHTKAVILDTRKTVPGLRVLDKMAVRIGGGTNHRFGLFDMALIKENHIAAAGGIAKAVEAVRAADTRRQMIEVEVRNMEELGEALAAGVDRILLDNMSPDILRSAVSIAAGRIPLEASGNVTLENIAVIAETGVDFISVGRLTHSVSALDISFLLQ